MQASHATSPSSVSSSEQSGLACAPSSQRGCEVTRVHAGCLARDGCGRPTWQAPQGSLSEVMGRDIPGSLKSGLEVVSQRELWGTKTVCISEGSKSSWDTCQRKEQRGCYGSCRQTELGFQVAACPRHSLPAAHHPHAPGPGLGMPGIPVPDNSGAPPPPCRCGPPGFMLPSPWSASHSLADPLLAVVTA